MARHTDQLDYDRMVEDALRGVMARALVQVATTGLPGNHHFYITFRTTYPGAVLPESLRARFPEEMTIVLQHQFDNLSVDETEFSVTLSFSNRLENLTVPFAAVTVFADPSVNFALQFPVRQPASEADQVAEKPPEDKGGEVVSLDQFRRK